LLGIQSIEHVETHGEALFREITRHDQEGIVAKRVDAPYRAGKQSTWIKIKSKEYSRRDAVEWRGRGARYRRATTPSALAGTNPINRQPPATLGRSAPLRFERGQPGETRA
jgi:hypothetical protein